MNNYHGLFYCIRVQINELELCCLLKGKKRAFFISADYEIQRLKSKSVAESHQSEIIILYNSF